MISIGTITGQEIKPNRKGGADVRLLQVRLSNDLDVQTIQHFPMPGDDSPPQKDDLVVVVSVTSSFRIALGVQDTVTPSMPDGERKIYSRDSSGDIAAFINFLAGGNLELNGNAYSAVRYQELETAFNQLQSDFDLHTHGGVTSGPSSTAPPTASTADITPAESDTVKMK